MILEVAIFAVKPEAIADFEAAYKQASPLIGRAKGKRFLVLSGKERVVYDADARAVAEEARHLRRKSAEEDAA